MERGVAVPIVLGGLAVSLLGCELLSMYFSLLNGFEFGHTVYVMGVDVHWKWKCFG